jgi:putative SOS response-associated peptidase YedK
MRKRGERPVESCTILTAEANGLLKTLHDRKPVILDPKDYDRWLDPALQEPTRLVPSLVPYLARDMTAYVASTRVNRPRNDGPRCVEPAEVEVAYSFVNTVVSC